jgi:hypothetical protein
MDASLKRYTDSVGKYEDSEDTLGKALTAWNSAADDPTKSKTAKKDDAGDSGSSALSAIMANDLAIIVQTIVWQSFMTEQCQKAVFVNYVATAASVRQFCLDHLKRADDVREKQLLGTLTVSTAGRPTSPQPAPVPPNFIPTVATPLQPPYLYVDPGLLEESVDKVMQRYVAPPAAPIAPPTSPPLPPQTPK